MFMHMIMFYAYVKLLEYSNFFCEVVKSICLSAIVFLMLDPRDERPRYSGLPWVIAQFLTLCCC